MISPSATTRHVAGALYSAKTQLKNVVLAGWCIIALLSVKELTGSNINQIVEITKIKTKKKKKI